MKRVPLVLVLAALLAPEVLGAEKTESFDALRKRYVKSFFQQFPVVATYLGASGLDPSLAPLDGALRDYREPALAREAALWSELAAKTQRVNRTKLSSADRVDLDVMTSQLAFLSRNVAGRRHEKALDVSLEEPFRGVDLLLLARTPQAGGALGTPEEWERIAERTEAIPAYLETALTATRAGVARGAASTPDRRVITVAVAAAEETAHYFETTLKERVAGAPNRDRVERAAARAAAAFRTYRDGLVATFYEKDGKTLAKAFDVDRYALGEKDYTFLLANSLREKRTPEELFRYGHDEVAKTLFAMTNLAASIAKARGFADSTLPGVLAKLSDDVPSGDAEMLSWYRESCLRLVDYGRKTGLFAPPETYKLEVVETPLPLRATTTAAYYPAPAFKKTGVGQFYVTPTGDDPVALREHARAAVASLAAHEGFPGHDWHYQFLRANASRVSPLRWLLPGGIEESTSMWADSFLVEGWALYTEELVGEPRPGYPKGFYTDEERLFALQNQLLRDVRVVVDTGIHTGRMSFDDAVTYFAKNVLFVKGQVSTDEKRNPSAEERASVAAAEKALLRYSKWPVQAITYNLGKAAIKSLKAEVRRIEGKDFDERRFHEEMLLEGTIPVGLFRDAFLERVEGRMKKTPRP
ncbi:MAG: DUF885 domain-containing protein [Acidobacteria bacterium]|nr:DUF885 domain-containing protein [Acidobacteriota bacterium]